MAGAVRAVAFLAVAAGFDDVIGRAFLGRERKFFPGLGHFRYHGLVHQGVFWNALGMRLKTHGP
jgi:hypothetical protein